MFEIWDGDLYLFLVSDEDEADMLGEQGFKVVKLA